MSPRVDALANDLLAQAAAASPGLRETYFTALGGVLASSGSRLSPLTRAAAGDALQSQMASAGELPPPKLCASGLRAPAKACGGKPQSAAREALLKIVRPGAMSEASQVSRRAGDDVDLLSRIASCLGEFLRHCEPADFEKALTQGALATSRGNATQRLGAALILASTASLAPARSVCCLFAALEAVLCDRSGRCSGERSTVPGMVCRVKEAGLTSQAVAATQQLARDEVSTVKEAACRVAGHLALAELRGNLPAGSALAPLVSTFAALLGPDQPSEVQRRQLHVSASATRAPRKTFERSRPRHQDLRPANVKED